MPPYEEKDLGSPTHLFYGVIAYVLILALGALMYIVTSPLIKFIWFRLIFYLS